MIHSSNQKRIFKDNGKNDRSSRSHHIFQIKIKTHDILGKYRESLLNIVDLAGSERRENPYAEEDKQRPENLMHNTSCESARPQKSNQADDQRFSKPKPVTKAVTSSKPP